MPRKTIIGVVGSEGSTAEADAKVFGKLAAANGWVVLTGGRNSGVMQAALQGAKDKSLSAPGLTIGLIPNTGSSVAPEVDIAIITDMNNARNNLVGLSSSVVVACGVEGAGTAAEVSLALKNKKRVVLLNASSQAQAFFSQIGEADDGTTLIRAVTSAEAAVVAVKDVLAGRHWHGNE
jgi:uncharacterized protein (TIGR00725 family)